MIPDLLEDFLDAGLRRACAWAAQVALAVVLAGPAGAQEGAGDPSAEQPQGELLGKQPFGAWQATLPGLAEPGAVTVGPNGAIYVAESAAHRVRVFDAQGRELLTLGATGSGPGELLDPRGLAVDAEGRVYVADSGNHRICVFSSDGRFERAFGNPGAGAGELNDPRGLALRDGELLVADARNHRVQIFGVEGTPRGALGGAGREPGSFNRPLDVAIAGDGAVLVADTDNHRIQKLARDGRPLASWGDFGPHPGLFVQPTGVDCQAGQVYVADRDNHRVQVFDESGALHYEWGVHALRPREAGGKLHYPDQVSVAPFGTFVVLAESFENRCQIFRRVEPGLPPNGELQRFERDTSAHYGPNLGLAPPWMALCEPSTPSLALYDLRGNEPILVTQLRRQGRGFAELLRPEAAAVDAERDLVHLADPGNRRIATYALQRTGVLRFDPSMLRLQRSVDLVALHAAGATGLRWPIEPTAITLGPGGELVVCDGANRVVVVLSRAFEVERVLSGGVAPFLRPVQVAFRGTGELLVVDELDARVRVLDARDPARELGSVGARGAGDGQFLRPYGIAVDGAGALYVSDSVRHDVQRFDAQGLFQARIGGEGIEPGRFFKPKALAWTSAEDGAGLLHVLDHGNHRGQLLRPDGTLAGIFGARMYTRTPTRPAPKVGAQ